MANQSKGWGAKLKGLPHKRRCGMVASYRREFFIMRKISLIMVALALFIGLFGNVVVEANAATWIDTSQVNEGIVKVTYPVKNKVTTKVMITKGATKYTYNLYGAETFPLQLGNGKYDISVLEHASGNSYKRVAHQEVVLDLAKDHVVYLNSVQNVKWDEKNAAIVKAKELTKNLKTDAEKVKAIYEYVYKTINYDNKLAATVENNYIPNIDNTLKTKLAICYDYSTLTAAMLRSVDIPAKLVMGQSAYVDVYHAWNEVFVDGKWIIIDTTVDAGLQKNGKKFEMAKEASKYKAEKVY